MSLCLRSAPVLLVLAALLSGCVSGRAYFRPAETRAERAGGAPVRTHYMVPVETGARGLLLHAEARTFLDQIGEDAAFPTLQFRLWVHNDTQQPLELRMAEFTATDDLGNRFEFSKGRYRGEPTTVAIAKPRTRGYADVYFHLPNDYEVLEPERVTLEWSLRVGEREYRQTTLFLRATDRAFHDPFLQLPMGSL